MSQNHLSNNLDKIIQLISIEQVRCLMKQMKMDDNSLSETTINETNNISATNTIASDKSGETLEQLTKINNTLLLIVDKISAIETEIKMLKEIKQSKYDDDEEHIKLQIEEKETEKDNDSVVDILNTVASEELLSCEENLEEEVDDSDDEILSSAEVETEIVKEIVEDLVSAAEEEEQEEEEQEEEVKEIVAVSSEEQEEEKQEEEVQEEEVQEEEKQEEDVKEIVAVSSEEEETDESEVEIEDDEPLSVAESKAESKAESEVAEDEEEVFEIEIDDVTYFATHEENGILYEVDKDGDVGKKVGIIKDGEPIFL
jgi:hypothetical protein